MASVTPTLLIETAREIWVMPESSPEILTPGTGAGEIARNGADQAALPLSAAQFQSAIEDLARKIDAQSGSPRAPPQAPRTAMENFLSSGAFFIALGLVLLLAAYVGLSFGVHTSFSFVLVVLGVAILLFGTGTQGIGRLESEAAKGRYSVAIAGGAGVLAIAIGFGMVEKGRDIQTVFDLQTRHVKLKLRPKADSTGDFSQYWGQFTVDGVPIPSINQGDFFTVILPYYYNDRLNRLSKKINYKLRPQDPAYWNDTFRKKIDDGFVVPLANVSENNSGSDFPEMDIEDTVDLRSSVTAEILLKAASEQTQKQVGSATPPSNVPSAEMYPQ